MPAPFFSAFDAISTPNGTWIKPGGQVVAYVRSTGVQNGDLPEVANNLVSTIAAGVARCRAGMNDIVMVLPGHAESISAGLFTAVSGAQVIGVPNPYAANAPTITLSATTSTIALSAANMTISGLCIQSTVAAITGAVVVTAAGVTFANNCVRLTGALGANSAIQVTGAAAFHMLDNEVVVDSTATIVSVTGAASTNLLIARNLLRQAQGTSGGVGITIANTTGISGTVADNYIGTATNLGAGAIGTLITYSGTNPVGTLFCFGNLGSDNSGSATLNAGITVPDANGDA